MPVFELLTAVFLCVLSVTDLRTKTIPGWASPAFGIAMGILHLLLPGMTLPECLMGLIPGAGLLVLSLIFRASMGVGDACAVMACGVAIGAERIFAELTAAFVLCAMLCAVLLIMKKIRRSDSLAFLPFLASSHMIVLIVKVVS